MANSGNANGNWKGGRTITQHGYVLIRVGKNHHLADVRGYAYEHRLVAEWKIGRRLLPKEQIHHINHDKLDNRPENIEVTPSRFHHAVLHRKRDSKLRLPEQQNTKFFCACGCGKSFKRFDSMGRPRKFISGHNPPDLSIQEKFIMACSSGKSIAQIANITGQSTGAVKVMASKLTKKGKVERKGLGIYGKIN